MFLAPLSADRALLKKKAPMSRVLMTESLKSLPRLVRQRPGFAETTVNDARGMMARTAICNSS